MIGNSKEDSYIIDWEKALIGECEQDLAHFLAPTTTFWKTDTQHMLANEIHLQRLIEGRHPLHSIVQPRDGAGHTVAEKTADTSRDIDTRSF